MQVTALIARVLLGVWFVYSGGMKIFGSGLDRFTRDVANYQLVKPPLDAVAAYTVPWLELIAGLCLMLGILRAARSSPSPVWWWCFPSPSAGPGRKASIFPAAATAATRRSSIGTRLRSSQATSSCSVGCGGWKRGMGWRSPITTVDSGRSRLPLPENPF